MSENLILLRKNRVAFEVIPDRWFVVGYLCTVCDGVFATPTHFQGARSCNGQPNKFYRHRAFVEGVVSAVQTGLQALGVTCVDDLADVAADPEALEGLVLLVKERWDRLLHCHQGTLLVDGSLQKSHVPDVVQALLGVGDVDRRAFAVFRSTTQSIDPKRSTSSTSSKSVRVWL